MNLSQGLGALAVALLMRKSAGTLAWKTVEQWLHDHVRPENNGLGYSGNALSRIPTNAFVELRREVGASGVRVFAHAHMAPNLGAFASKTWNAKRLDTELEKRFGHNQRIRIDI